ncbi:MAG: site-specific DNA-methyltransferase [Deltaproteobacteria bacterium]|nr:site-specific DNA-methyltransferase [Deltaproteobacteria bacterium]
MTNAKIIIGDSRVMPEVEAESVHLVVTSPPYWHIKDYGQPGQIGYGQTLHEYLKDLYCVWRECRRVLKPGRRLCINIGDQFARAAVYGRYKIIPLHAEIIGQCEELGFDFLGSVIWQKKTTMNTSGGANVMGSYPYPPNGLVEIDYEFILIFKKPGSGEKIPAEIKKASELSKEEWKEYFAGHWRFGGARQLGHEAMFPEELPRRLIKMFTFVGDTVLDPFLGSGTTMKAALAEKRQALGYEINEDFLEVIQKKLGIKDRLPFNDTFQLVRRDGQVKVAKAGYTPRLPDAAPVNPAGASDNHDRELHRVVGIIDEQTIRLADGQQVQFLGVKIAKPEETLKYLQARILGKSVFIKKAVPIDGGDSLVAAQVCLKNKINVNGYLLKSGLAVAEPHGGAASIPSSDPCRPD